MNEKLIKELTDEELLEKGKKAKSAEIIGAVLIGCLVGVSVFGAVKSGFKFFTFFPLVFVVILARSRRNNKELYAEIKARNLKL